MNDPRDRLDNPQTIILDGGLATELEARGYRLDDALWSASLLMDDPDAIRDVHLSYLAAGADVITTATYQATFEGFEKKGLHAEASRALMQKAVDCALEARSLHRGETTALVAARPATPKPVFLMKSRRLTPGATSTLSSDSI